MSVFHKTNSHKNNTGHFVIIAVILLVGFASTVYFLKHPVVKSGVDSPISIVEKPTASDGDNKTTADSGRNSNNSTIVQTGLPVTGAMDGLFQTIPMFILSFVLSKYLLSSVKLRRYF